jgi:hypothetical protein
MVTKLKIQLRAFNIVGNEAFTEIMQSQPNDMFEQVYKLVNDDTKTTKHDSEIELKPFTSRYELGAYLWNYFQSNKLSNLDNLGDTYLWNWLAASWMQILVDADQRKDLSQKIGRYERWVLTENVRRYHWHVVSNPFFIYANNSDEPEKAMALLATDVLKPGDLVDKIASNRRYQKPPISYLATLLYYDQVKKQLRPGHTSRAGEGNQLSKYLNQIDRTVDFEGLSVEELVDLLPNNFSEWVGYAKKELVLAAKKKRKSEN